MRKVIVGLGNPGTKYAQNRHNIGFMVVDHLAKQNFKSFKGIADYAADSRAAYLKPMTYMNDSGFPLRKFLDYFKYYIEDVLVIYDDLDLPFGTLRFRENGRSGGHNGIKSIIEHLGTEQFKRLKIGIGSPIKQRTATKDFVLDNFASDEKKHLELIIENSVKAAKMFLAGRPFKDVMSRFNKNYLTSLDSFETEKNTKTIGGEIEKKL